MWQSTVICIAHPMAPGTALESITSKKIRRPSRALLILLASIAAIAAVSILPRAAQLSQNKTASHSCSGSSDGGEEGNKRLPNSLQWNNAPKSRGRWPHGQGTGETPWKIPERTAGTCWSKAERHLYYHNSVVPPMSEALREKLRDYEIMHARCVNSVSNWTNLFLKKGRPQAPGCKFIIPSCPAGLGNNFVSMMSVFVYALLTDRVLLLWWSNMRNSLCSPFPASDWNLIWYLDQPVREQQFSAPRLPQLMEMKKNGTLKGVNRAWLWQSWDWTAEDEVFFCTEGQEVLSNVTWLILHSEQYAVPGYFQMPYFRSKMETWFPNRIVFGQLVPYLLHPSNLMWERITRTYAAYHAHADRRVGIQVRTFDEPDEYAHERILHCAVNISGVLPPTVQAVVWVEEMQYHHDPFALKPPESVATYAVQRIVAERRPRTVSVFVTSMHSHFPEFFQSYYGNSAAVDGSFVRVSSGAHEGVEAHEMENDRRAMAEMWLLSFSDDLLTSDASTFGYLAAGLAGVRPYLMNNRNKAGADDNYKTNGRPVCILNRGIEPCYHFHAKRTLECLENRTDVVACQDFPWGLQLVEKLYSNGKYAKS